MPDLPAAHKLRFGRYTEVNRIYLLTSTTYQRKPIFTNVALGKLVAD